MDGGLGKNHRMTVRTADHQTKRLTRSEEFLLTAYRESKNAFPNDKSKGSKDSRRRRSGSEQTIPLPPEIYPPSVGKSVKILKNQIVPAVLNYPANPLKVNQLRTRRASSNAGVATKAPKTENAAKSNLEKALRSTKTTQKTPVKEELKNVKSRKPIETLESMVENLAENTKKAAEMLVETSAETEKSLNSFSSESMIVGQSYKERVKLPQIRENKVALGENAAQSVTNQESEIQQRANKNVILLTTNQESVVLGQSVNDSQTNQEPPITEKAASLVTKQESIILGQSDIDAAPRPLTNQEPPLTEKSASLVTKKESIILGQSDIDAAPLPLTNQEPLEIEKSTNEKADSLVRVIKQESIILGQSIFNDTATTNQEPVSTEQSANENEASLVATQESIILGETTHENAENGYATISLIIRPLADSEDQSVSPPNQNLISKSLTNQSGGNNSVLHKPPPAATSHRRRRSSPSLDRVYRKSKRKGDRNYKKIHRRMTDPLPESQSVELSKESTLDFKKINLKPLSGVDGSVDLNTDTGSRPISPIGVGKIANSDTTKSFSSSAATLGSLYDPCENGDPDTLDQVKWMEKVAAGDTDADVDPSDSGTILVNIESSKVKEKKEPKPKLKEKKESKPKLKAKTKVKPKSKVETDTENEPISSEIMVKSTKKKKRPVVGKNYLKPGILKNGRTKKKVTYKNSNSGEYAFSKHGPPQKKKVRGIEDTKKRLSLVTPKTTDDMEVISQAIIIIKKYQKLKQEQKKSRQQPDTTSVSCPYHSSVEDPLEDKHHCPVHKKRSLKRENGRRIEKMTSKRRETKPVNAFCYSKWQKEHHPHYAYKNFFSKWYKK